MIITNPITWEDVKELQHICEAHDSIVLKLNWDTLLSRKPAEKADLAEYRDGRLIGFLGFYDFGSSVELCGMVHPDYRCQGIFTRLLQKALNPESLSAYKRILLNAPENSESAKAFMSTVPFTYDFSEYQMKHEPSGDLSLPVRDDVMLRSAEAKDVPVLARLDSEGFDLPLEESVSFYENYETIAENEVLMLDENPVGKLRVSRSNREAWIYGFAVSPTYRGHGIGSAALRQIVRRETAAGYEVWLEVALDNPNAMRLYESTGFRTVRAQDYYRYNFSESS
ncbi:MULTISPECIES: GNAT family N-acetyltransferase [Paenibacillus]|uniref:GNAT family N-acetyltransferase n=1 Tax=Paenibacillus TaxID=44249 RepID=UPI002FE01C2F